MDDGSIVGVFPEDVNALSFDDFTNWSLDNDNLTIYFDQYAIGPGVLGATAFPLPRTQIQNFLAASYQSLNPTKPIDTSSWKTSTDSKNKVSFKYPADLGTKYISIVDWPPKIQIQNEVFLCNEAGQETSVAGQTTDQKINGTEYCITKESEGAAGSMYTNYAYATEINNKEFFFTFSLRFVQCANYDEPQQSACETERAAFNIDQTIDQIVKSVKSL